MIIRQSAFCDQKKMLKGGLHCHTTRSDGQLSPEDTIQLHADHGYDFLALTDHRIYNYKDFNPGAGLTIIPGMEFDKNIAGVSGGFRCYHIVCLGYECPENKFEQDQTFEGGYVSSQEEMQEYLDMIHANNNITFYCHPEWSSTPTRFFDKLEGNFAMEVWNTGGAMDNDQDTNAPYWSEMIGLGHKIYGVAVDDGHSKEQHCGGWVMVNSDNDVVSILDALKEGRFYSSCGPEIEDFYFEPANSTVHIKCSPCVQIDICSDAHPTVVVRAQPGETMTERVISCGGYDFLRASVIDAEGRRAWTNPIFIKEELAKQQDA